MAYDVLIVGAGFAGSVCAERLAAAGRQVLLIDRRSHVGGNAFDEHDEHGVLVHRYGPHIFHTNAKAIFAYLSRFTHWRFYEHRVLAAVDGRLYPVPINRTTINALYGLSLAGGEVETYLSGVREARDPVTTSEDVVLNRVGRDLCDKFFRGYTRKQWGLDLADLDAGVVARIPVRTDDDDRYFTDSFQFMPSEGYAALFARMLDRPGIDVQTGTDYADIRDPGRFALTIYTGPIDTLFGCRFGPLPYRSLRFAYEHVADTDRFQPVGTVNYPNDHAFTRITEFRHLTGQAHRGTSIVREFPADEGDPYYPVPRPQNRELYRRYAVLAAETPALRLVGRLAQYQYYNMDQVVGAALAVAKDALGQ